jgi:hypothetical protein
MNESCSLAFKKPGDRSRSSTRNMQGTGQSQLSVNQFIANCKQSGPTGRGNWGQVVPLHANNNITN